VTRGKLAVRVVVALACAIGAIVLVTGIRPASSVPATGTRTPSTTGTPLWSARRIPAFLARAVESQAQAHAAFALTKQLSGIVARVDACVAVDGPVGALARVGAGQALAPASTLKLLTATTALARLGPDHRFTTRTIVDASGNLVVIGGGDPLLATPEHIAYEHSQARFHDAPTTPLAALADAIVAAGVHRVTGALLVDDHVHETLRFLPGWKAVYTQEGDVGSLGALAVDGGFDQPNDTIASADPALTTGARLATLLEARGVTIANGVRRADHAETGRDVAHVDSPTLSQIVGEMLTSSDNFTAETLLRDIAVGGEGNSPATTDLGTRIVLHEMTVLGVPNADVVMHDGSGLDPTDRVPCATMLGVIELSSEPKFAAVDKGLPIAGETGTLIGRFVGGPLAGKLRAKTGSIAGVVGLVGVIDGPDDLHFAFLANGDFSAAAGSDLQDQVAAAIAATPDLRAPANLVPPP
jgi:D-alanyl-D-alanine carboxypeptidase/D-alanyl-D-alanine-endopeptidase (penicillin-binding protein 4)